MKTHTILQVFVETLDKCFENVCELDLIFHVDKVSQVADGSGCVCLLTAETMTRLFLQVHYILNELVMGGMVLETNMTEIIARIEDQSRIEKQEVRRIPGNAVNFVTGPYFRLVCQQLRPVPSLPLRT